MIVVANTSPINYLILIGSIDILPALFGQVIIPEAVYRDLTPKGAPQAVKEWLASSPEWLEVRSVTSPISDPRIAALHPGEREAIALAIESKASLLLIDEKKGMEVAQEKQLTTVRTTIVIEKAGDLGLIDAEEALKRLAQTSYRIKPEHLLNQNTSKLF